MKTITTQDDLEELIDNCGLHGLFNLVVQVCHEKAEHVQTNRQDGALADRWTKAAKQIDRMTATLDNLP